MSLAGSNPIPTRQIWAGAIIVMLGFGAMVYWARSAALVTTIEVVGQLHAPSVSIEVQAARAGQISQVYKANFSDVKMGEVLAEFDADGLHAQRHELLQTIEIAEWELRILEAAQSGDLKTIHVAKFDPVLASYKAEYNEHLKFLDGLKLEQTNSAANKARILNELSLSKDRTRLQEAKVSALSSLQQSGHFSEIEFNEVKSDLVALNIEIVQLKGQAAAFQQNIDVISQRRTTAEAERQNRLALRRVELERQITEAAHQFTRVDIEIERSKIIAPKAGTLTDWMLSAGSVVSASEVMGQITSELAQLQIDLSIPAQAVDQVFEAQKGLVVFPTLPQRDIPRVNVEVVSLAQSSVVDPVSGQSFYSSVAAFEADSLDQITEYLGTDYRLTLGVPVTVILEGRDITLWDYAVHPISSVLRRAFVD